MSSSSWNSPFVSGSMLGFLFSMIEVGTCAIHDDFQYPFRYLKLDFLSKKIHIAISSFFTTCTHMYFICFIYYWSIFQTMVLKFDWWFPFLSKQISDIFEKWYTYWLNPKATFYIDGGRSFFMCALSKSNKKINLA